jgi:hypothetical protein
MSKIVTQLLDSMVAHDPYAVPMAPTYKATENWNPAAIGMMTSWRTIVKAGPLSLLAIDTTNGTAYFALDVSEGNEATDSVLRGRIKVVHQKITELELFINCYRGDHDFSFSAAELPANYEALMLPPANRTKASRATLEALSESLFTTSSNFSVTVGDNCQFTELGWEVVDPGTNGTGSTTPLDCTWPSDHPMDTKVRVGLLIDEKLGFVVTSGVILGKVYPHGNISAFIPDAMTAAQEAQEVYQGDGSTWYHYFAFPYRSHWGYARSASVLQWRAPGHADQCLHEWPEYDIAVVIVNVVNAVAREITGTSGRGL